MDFEVVMALQQEKKRRQLQKRSLGFGKSCYRMMVLMCPVIEGWSKSQEGCCCHWKPSRTRPNTRDVPHGGAEGKPEWRGHEVIGKFDLHEGRRVGWWSPCGPEDPQSWAGPP